MASHQKRTRPLGGECNCVSTIRLANSLMEPETSMDGTRANVSPFQKKGNLADPNKWRGIMLMDVCSKIFSSVMNNHAFHLLELHGTRFQFGGTPEIGCQDRLFTLKALINVQCNHDLGSYVGFVGLVKAYDVANHELLFGLLEKYAPPPHLSLRLERYIHLMLWCSRLRRK
jgi:hypothetical protein